MNVNVSHCGTCFYVVMTKEPLLFPKSQTCPMCGKTHNPWVTDGKIELPVEGRSGA